MENIVDLLQKYFSGECNAEEKSAVESWIVASAENQKIFNEIRGIWENAKNVTNNITLHTESAWRHIKQETGIKDWKTNLIGLNTSYRNLLKIAATLLIVIGIGTVVKLSYYNKTEFITVSTYNSTKQEVHLSDGSVVYLNHGSQLKYPEEFASPTREIELEGEAFFKVAKDSVHPFIVHAKGTNTRVLGTSFNINTKNQEQVSIAVFSGKVAFRSESSTKQEVKLLKGENGIFYKSSRSITKQIGANDNAIAWQTGILTFNKTSLTEAASVLSGYYSRTIKVAPQLQNRLISVTFDNQPLDKVLEILELTLGIKSDTTSEKILLTPLDK